MSDGEEDNYHHKNVQAAAAAAANAGARGGRKKSILALNDPHAVFDALQAMPNLAAVSDISLTDF